jgi:hypothetical protein
VRECRPRSFRQGEAMVRRLSSRIYDVASLDARERHPPVP